MRKQLYWNSVPVRECTIYWQCYRPVVKYCSFCRFNTKIKVRWKYSMHPSKKLHTIPWDSSVGIAMGYGLKNRGIRSSIAGRGKKFFPSAQCPDLIWDPPNLVYNGYRGLIPCGQISQCVKLTMHLHLLPRLRMVELYTHSPNRSSRHGASLIKLRNFTFTLANLNNICSHEKQHQSMKCAVQAGWWDLVPERGRNSS
jgi:hypothetical protein